MAKRLTGTSQEDNQMADKYMKRFPTSLIIQKMLIKATIKTKKTD